MKNWERYQEIAAEHGRAAQAAQLDNVRERCLRSEDAWTKMAVRARRMEEGRDRG